MTTRINKRQGSTVDAIDMFCGFGGSSGGIHAAGADVRLATNHWDLAIDVHARNFPNTDHLVADLNDPNDPRDADGNPSVYVDPASLPPARYLWASPSCKFHSPANSKKLYRAKRAGTLTALLAGEPDALYAKSERSRVTMVCPLRYAAANDPEIVVIENVVEAAKWGPDRDGSTFAWWLRQWDTLGYEWRALFLNSMFFPPTPQSRDRMYVVFWKKGNRAPDLEFTPFAHCGRCGDVEAVQSWKQRTKAWPSALEQWGKYRAQYVYRCPSCNDIVEPVAYPSYTAIDWSDLGPTIGERTKDLAPKTIARIERGLAKFKDWPAVLVKAAGNTFERPGQLRARPVGDPFGSQTGTNEWALAAHPFLIEMRGGGSVKAGQHSVTEPMHGITAGGFHHGLVNAMTLPITHDGDRTKHITGPMDTITGSRERYMAAWTKVNGGPTDTAWHRIDEAFQTFTGRDTTGMITSTEPVVLDDVHFRMLKPDPELRFGMGFDADYELVGTNSQMAQGLGNAVTPPVSEWITARCLASLG